MKYLLTCLLVLAGLGCETEPTAVIPDASGIYSAYWLEADLSSNCPGVVPTADIGTVISGNQVTARGEMSLEQFEGGAIEGTFGFSGCEADGVINANAQASLVGSCVLFDREISYVIDAVLTDGVTPVRIRLDGTMVAEVDYTDGGDGGPDGSPDCTISAAFTGEAP